MVCPVMVAAAEFGLSSGQLGERLPQAFGLARLASGLLNMAPPLGQDGVVAVLELLGGGRAGLHRGRSQSGQELECLGDGGVDRDAADP